jgi:hypothetical protein
LGRHAQNGAFMPPRKYALLDQAEERDQVAPARLESYFRRADRRRPAW